ncbi:hypothetical protein BISA_0827 [Bifidobacterium saguini DSM 23967]|uniref:Uncharacterized protein n=2 Tax=Bifidobacterium saguini TaxID=762210 RepID=A0A087DA77_9BIFI|nr:hypothetical protein [Bifidobacterium saguini]KFI92427.1 hypothetical protein BISA_0827 [Bifidobacterium saguini DSM 23967]QTB90846.1 hypothetical protein BSD967_11285 [Bifidobacterium saguini]QTB90895.1 hypothetical protein BSD967_00055 [Bifidobacterium saguini]
MANAWKKMGSLRGPAGAGADVATSEKAGIVKPSNDFDVTADGTLSLYTAMSISSFTGGSDHEIGETVDTVNLAWKLNKTPTTLTLDGQEITKGTDGQFPASQPLTGQGIKANKTYTLAATDARGSKAQKSTSVLFHYKRYWGVGENPADGVDSAFLLALAGSELGDTKSKTFTVNAAAGQYIWYAIPHSFGTPTFKVGGFEGGFNLVKTFDHTNASGATVSYDVYQSTNASLGQTTVEAN